jgi:hypothetical protein
MEDVAGAIFFSDFGVITATDQTTVDVKHAVRPFVAGQQLAEELETKGVEVLWPGGGDQYSEKWTLKAGDTVLLVGLKDFVKTVANVPAETNLHQLHYAQQTMKAIPMGAYQDSTVHLIIETGKWKLTATEIDLNGDTKTFVTWAELNQALQLFLTTLIATLTLAGAAPPLNGLSLAGMIPTLDISAAKTTTVKTGG